jgi:hypothetical protein
MSGETLRDFLVRVDSITSLVAYRHARGRCEKDHPWSLPPDVVEELKEVSLEARGRYEQMEPKTP